MQTLTDIEKTAALIWRFVGVLLFVSVIPGLVVLILRTLHFMFTLDRSFSTAITMRDGIQTFGWLVFVLLTGIFIIFYSRRLGRAIARNL